MKKIAILYQAKPAPAKNGIKKPMKPSGYSDSGADIAYELLKNGMEVISPVTNLRIDVDKDWVFPDTTDGIETALGKGAEVLWLNTVLYKNHPIINFYDREIRCIGQIPSEVDLYDDKFYTNGLLRKHGIPIPKTQLINLKEIKKYKLAIEFPLVVKPLRGRGSQGVSLIKNRLELDEISKKLFFEKLYGDSVYVENFLNGEELTISVMPPGIYKIENQKKEFLKPWCLPAVRRINHKNGIAPYSGVVAVMENSAVLKDFELEYKSILDINKHCVKAAEILNIKAPIRIDCRADTHGNYFIFDVNMKPNMTGPSRPHRKNQDSLTLMAARKFGWSYFDLLINMVGQKWLGSSQNLD